MRLKTMTNKISIRHLLILIAVSTSIAACDQRTAEEKGKAVAAEKAGYVKGIGEALKKEGEEAAQSLGEGVGKVVKSASAGVEGGYSSFASTLSPETAAMGLNMTRAYLNTAAAPSVDEHKEDAGKHRVSTYLHATNGYSGKLSLTALDGRGQEIGRAVGEIQLGRGDAGYVDFLFDKRTPIMETKTVRLQHLASH